MTIFSKFGEPSWCSIILLNLSTRGSGVANAKPKYPPEALIYSSILKICYCIIMFKFHTTPYYSVHLVMLYLPILLGS